MFELLRKKYIKYPLLGFYTLVNACFLGFMLVWTLPIPGIRWPFYLVIHYTLGTALGVLITLIIFKWSAPLKKKILVAAAVMIVTNTTSTVVAFWEIQQVKIRVNQMLLD